MRVGVELHPGDVLGEGGGRKCVTQGSGEIGSWVALSHSWLCELCERGVFAVMPSNSDLLTVL